MKVLLQNVLVDGKMGFRARESLTCNNSYFIFGEIFHIEVCVKKE